MSMYAVNRLKSHFLFWPGLVLCGVFIISAIGYFTALRNLPAKIVQTALETQQLTVSFDDLDIAIISSTPRLSFKGFRSAHKDDTPILDNADFAINFSPWSLLGGHFSIRGLESTTGSLDFSALQRWRKRRSVNQSSEAQPEHDTRLELDAMASVRLSGLTVGYFDNETELVLKTSFESVLDENGDSRQSLLTAEGEINGLPSELELTLDSQHLNSVAAEVKKLTIGDSDLAGDLSFEREQDKVTVAGALVSQLLQLGELSGADRRLRRSQSHASGSKVTTSSTDSSQTASKRGQDSGDKIFTGEPLGLASFGRAFNGQINYEIKEARFRSLYTSDISLQLNGRPGTTQLNLQTDDMGSGLLRSEILLTSAASVPKVNIETSIEQVKVQELMSVAGDEGTVSGTFSGRLAYESSGHSAAELAGNLQGDLLLLAESGQLDAMLVELAGIDIAEALTLLIKKDIKNTKINCAFMLASTEKGKTILDDFLIDTSDTVFLGEGYVDLSTERVNVLIKPYPRDISFFAAPTAIRISGGISAPTVKPAKTLFARLAAAAALATTATPVAALLPFMSLGSEANETGCNDLLH